MAGVVLTARQKIVNFPVNIAASVLYGVVFWRGGLLSSAGLQLFFVGIALWDWRQWAAGEQGGELRVRRTPLRVWAALLLVCALGTGVQGCLLLRFTPAAAVWSDAALSWASMGAQWMVGRKFVENWAVWIVVDAIYIWFYWTQRLPMTSALYALFCALAVWGWLEWRRSGQATA